MDKKDKIILYELDRNARQPLTKIAKKAKLSRESVLYRVRKFRKLGLIRNFLIVIDMARLGYTHYKIYLKLHNISEDEEKGLISYLCTNPLVSWVASCDGAYSLIFAIKARSIVDLNEHMKKLRNKFWQFIKEAETTTNIRGQYFYRDYLVGNVGTTERIIEWGGKPKEVKLDEINGIILDAVSEDPRISAVDIANQTKISADTVIQRLKKLENDKVIQHYMIWPNVNKLMGNYYKVLISLHNINEENENKLASYCQQNPYIVYSVNAYGRWQFEIDLEVENVQHFRELIREFLNKFSDIVSDYTVLNIYEEYKYRFFEKKILKAPGES